MNTKQLIATVAMLTATGAVLANSEYTAPDDGFVSSRTRAEVISELKQAKADGSYQTANAEYQGPVFALTGNAGAAAEPVAVPSSQVKQATVLKDGSIVYVFKDGKMGMENTFGNVVRMKQGHAMETRDGQRIIMIGDEVARLDTILNAEYPGQ